MNIFFDNYSGNEKRTGVQKYSEQIFQWLELAGLPMTRFGFGDNYTQDPNIKQIASFIPQKLANRLHRYNILPPLDRLTLQPVSVAVFPDFVCWPMPAERTAVVIHDTSYLDVPSSVSPPLRRYLTAQVQKSINTADFVIVSSHVVKNRLIEIYGTSEEAFLVVPALPAPPNSSTSKSFSVPKAHRSAIVSINTLTPRKNTSRLIEAYRLLPHTTKQNHPLVLIGKNGGDTHALNAIHTARTDGENIHYLDYASDVVAQSYLMDARVFVYPSVYEGFGMQLLEAAAVGTAIACSDIPIFHEVIGDGAVYFSPEDTTQICKTLSNLLSQEELRQKITQSANKQLAMYSSERNIYTLKKLTL